MSNKYSIDTIENRNGKKIRKKLKIPEDKIVNYKSAFDMIDINKNGSIGEEEIYDFFQNIGNDLTMEEVKEIIVKFDFDCNGTLEFDEFICVMENMNDENKLEDDPIYKAFYQFDKNKTGFISIFEFKSIVKNIAKGINEKEVKMFLDESGMKLGDLIDYKDFVKNWRENFGWINKI